jgi:nucleolar MIF4G domain-containing protein 1
MRNVANAYAWWIAKNCCSLAILKPVDFTVLKPQTREFFKEFLMQVIISSQAATPVLSSNERNQLASRNRGAVEEIFIKATKIEMLAMGLMYFMSEAFRGELGDSEGVLEWGINVAKDTLRTVMDAIPTI